ncbi:MAG: NTPase [Deltaproteobacteria bacterium]|nr:NTPase [Deltaproteobacteria bacterium]
MRLLLTGFPGIGKTTVVRTALRNLEGIKCAGFYTEEKRYQRERIGFKIMTLDGEEGTLASIDRGREPTVGRYTVHVEEFERLALPLIDPEITPADLYIIDEIGKMELLSQRFRTKLIDLLARPSNLLATIAKKGKGFVEQIKGRNDIELIEVTRENRDRLPEEIVRRVKREIDVS